MGSWSHYDASARPGSGGSLEGQHPCLAPVREAQEVRGFGLDTTGWTMPEHKELPPGQKIVQVVGGPNKVYSLQYEDGKQRYSVSAPAGFHKGQKLVVGIGYEISANQKVNFYPTWIGLVNVK